jgi:hypothetical protein
MNSLAKRIAAIILLVSFFLPLSQCSVTPPPRQEHQEVKNEVIYAYSAYEWPSFGGFAALAAFVWPMWFAFRKSKSPKMLLNSLELLLCASTVYMLAALTYLGSWLYGAYLAAVAIGVYLLATFHQIIKRFKTNVQPDKT